MAEEASHARAQEDLLVKVLGELATQDQLDDMLASMGVSVTTAQHDLLHKVVTEVRRQAQEIDDEGYLKKGEQI